MAQEDEFEDLATTTTPEITAELDEAGNEFYASVRFDPTVDWQAAAKAAISRGDYHQNGDYPDEEGDEETDGAMDGPPPGSQSPAVLMADRRDERRELLRTRRVERQMAEKAD